MTSGRPAVSGAGTVLPRTEQGDEPALLQRAGWQISASVLRLKGEAEAALRRANERLERQADEVAASAALLQATLESTVDAVIAVNLEGRIVVHNSRFERVWALPPGLLASGDYAAVCDRISEQLRDKVRYAEVVERTRTDPERSLSHEVFERLDGGIVERFTSPQRIGERCVGVVVNWRDVSERERVAAALQAQEVAEQTARARSEFLARMSHELRTPLNAVIGFADLLQLDDETPMTEGQKRFVGHIRRAGTNLLLLINDVLDISRIDAGQMNIELADVDTVALVREVLAQLAPAARAAGVQVYVGPSNESSLHARADRTRLRQVLLNLVSNAIKYNRAGGHVAVGATPSGGRVRITVSDDGLGMSAEQVAALYQPFNRLGRERGSVDGTGIGLVIARSLTELMGGSLTVTSQAGSGSDFVIELGACTEDGPRTEAADTAPGALLRRSGRGCVLYIDENEVNRLLMEAFMAHRAGVELVLASSGELGLELMRQHRPDLVLLDILLPGLDGYAVLRELRADPSLRRTPCVAVSASAMPEDIRRALEAGFDGYLTKPLTLATLLPEIDRRLED